MPSPEPREIADALLRHFDAHQRPMPWRETSDPYAIWVSEVMLQQTRVDTVIPYWERWLDRFPTVADLAEADLDDVLKEWEGLGYYSRARNLHNAARMVRERFDGRVPEDVEGLRELPGVGAYTAGAVASIAYGVATPAVDGNVRRVLARLYDLEAPTPAELRDRAAALVPERRPGDFNQALMELGATLCTPRSPSCDACPVAGWCTAWRLGVQELRPLPREKKPIPEETVETAVIVRDDGALLLARRPDDGLLGGLWEFPGAAPGGDWPEGVAHWVEVAERAIELEPVRHVFSHKRVTYRPEVLRLSEAVGTPVGGGTAAAAGAGDPPGRAGGTVAWADDGSLDDYAMPVAQQKIAAAVRVYLAHESE